MEQGASQRDSPLCSHAPTPRHNPSFVLLKEGLGTDVFCKGLGGRQFLISAARLWLFLSTAYTWASFMIFSAKHPVLFGYAVRGRTKLRV